MTNAELILKLVEMLLKEKENATKSEEKQCKDQIYIVHSRSKANFTGLSYFFYAKKKKSMYIYGVHTRLHMTHAESVYFFDVNI